VFGFVVEWDGGADDFIAVVAVSVYLYGVPYVVVFGCYVVKCVVSDFVVFLCCRYCL